MKQIDRSPAPVDRPLPVDRPIRSGLLRPLPVVKNLDQFYLWSIVFEYFVDTPLYTRTDLIARDFQCGECLWKWWVNDWIRPRAVLVILLCFPAEHWIDVVLLVDQFDSTGGTVWWVSVEIVSECLNKKKSGASHVTLFCCRACARYCAPWSPISFPVRISVVSVCGNSEWMIE
jgi:hypothetical protein